MLFSSKLFQNGLLSKHVNNKYLNDVDLMIKNISIKSLGIKGSLFVFKSGTKFRDTHGRISLYKTEQKLRDKGCRPFRG